MLIESRFSVLPNTQKQRRAPRKGRRAATRSVSRSHAGQPPRAGHDGHPLRPTWLWGRAARWSMMAASAVAGTRGDAPVRADEDELVAVRDAGAGSLAGCVAEFGSFGGPDPVDARQGAADAARGGRGAAGYGSGRGQIKPRYGQKSRRIVISPCPVAAGPIRRGSARARAVRVACPESRSADPRSGSRREP